MPVTRKDKGASRALPDIAIERIYALKQEFPRMNATQIYHQLIKESFIDSTVNVCTVQRFIKNHDLKSARNPNVKDRKAFEEDSFGKIWQADTKYLPYITEDGISRRVYCIGILDDYSRMELKSQLFYADNAVNFQKVLKDSIAAYGIPDKLYVDNGCSYLNEQLELICGELGIVLIHAPVRDGAAKGKRERAWRTLDERFLFKLNPSEIHSLEQFNEMYRDYVRSYNTTVHLSAAHHLNVTRRRRTISESLNRRNGWMSVSSTGSGVLYTWTPQYGLAGFCMMCRWSSFVRL